MSAAYAAGLAVQFVLVVVVGGRSWKVLAWASLVTVCESLRLLPSLATVNGYGGWTAPFAAGAVARMLVLSYLSYAMFAPVAGRSLRKWNRMALLGFFVTVLTVAALNALVTSAPPWAMGFPRLALQETWSGSIVQADPDPMGAWPSLHVAVPAALAWWGRSVRWGAVALLTSAVVVLTGEHWLSDVLTSWVLVAVLAVVCDGRGLLRAARRGQVASDGVGSVARA